MCKEFAKPLLRGRGKVLVSENRSRAFNPMKTAFFKLLLATIISTGITTIARADALDNWTRSQVPTNVWGYQGFELRGVAYMNGKYVAVGDYATSDSGVVQYSMDGINWTNVFPYFGILNLFDITCGNGLFVAVGWDASAGNNIYSSPDGTNWTAHQNTDVANFYRVIYGNGLFVAVGDGLLAGLTATNRQIYTSADGLTWTRRNSGAPATDVHTIYDIAYGNGKFVAVDAAGYSYTSTTGLIWTRNSIGFNAGSISFCNDRFIASGSGANHVSTDGTSWASMVKDVTNTLGRIVYTNGLYMALPGFTSTNGTNWIQHSFNPPANLSLYGFAVGKTNAVVVGMLYTNVYPTAVYPCAFASGPFIGLDTIHSPAPQLKMSGVQGWNYRIDYATNLQPANNWQALATVTLTNSPQIWTDFTATNSQRFYRLALP